MTSYKKKPNLYEEGYIAGLRERQEPYILMPQMYRRPLDMYFGIMQGMLPLDMMLGGGMYSPISSDYQKPANDDTKSKYAANGKNKLYKFH